LSGADPIGNLAEFGSRLSHEADVGISEHGRDRRSDPTTRASHKRDLPVEAKWILIVHGILLSGSSLAALVAALTRGWLRR
jgi:hypoxanthine-guanine phosphoribosyltransferase